MMKMLKMALCLLPITLYGQVAFTPVGSDQDIKKIMNYFTTESGQGGGAYIGSTDALNEKILPMSYYSTPAYWGSYVASIPGNDCTVTDKYDSWNYTLTPTADSPGRTLQVERVNVYNGTDIYDAATWQIALALGGNKGMRGVSSQSLFDIAENQNQLLFVGYDGQAKVATKNANRATTQMDGTFTYNGQRIEKPEQAYFFRMITKNWLSTDPFKGTQYEHYISVEGLPSNPDYALGKITWMDWKPITGENAWAFLIGPLQAAYLQEVVHGNKAYVPYQHLAVQNALGVLYAFRCMQSPIGAVYYAAKGSLGNQGSEQVNPHEVSVENNASLLAGLRMLQQVVQGELDHELGLSNNDRLTLQAALDDIHVMINGGKTLQGETQGLLAFFKDYAWDKQSGLFYQGGLANDLLIGSPWQPTQEPKAVDVTTWGVAVIGQPTLDNWFGFGSAYTAWTNVRKWAGFFGPDATLWGVGYSDQDGNGSGTNYRQGILSGEWTAGAINMVRVLLEQYTAVLNSDSHSAQEKGLAQQYVADLKKDEASMVAGLHTLRTDQYSKVQAYDEVRPSDYDSLIPLPSDNLAYLYASKRYMIPFGWVANPLPSTASTAWAVMLHYNYNPFVLGGN